MAEEIKFLWLQTRSHFGFVLRHALGVVVKYRPSPPAHKAWRGETRLAIHRNTPCNGSCTGNHKNICSAFFVSID